MAEAGLFHAAHCQVKRGGVNCDCGAANGAPIRMNEQLIAERTTARKKPRGLAKKVPEPGILIVLFVLQNGCCFHCQRKLTGPLTRDNQALSWNEDHLLPKTAGGKTSNNVVISCYECNHKKSGRMPTDEETARAQILHARALALGIAFFGRNPWPNWSVV